jgi:hypothetical protein
VIRDRPVGARAKRPIDRVMALTTEQCEIVGALLDQDIGPAERTTDMLAKRVDMSPQQVGRRLEEMQARSPQLARLVYDEEWHVKAWMITDAGRETYDRWCRT